MLKIWFKQLLYSPAFITKDLSHWMQQKGLKGQPTQLISRIHRNLYLVREKNWPHRPVISQLIPGPPASITPSRHNALLTERRRVTYKSQVLSYGSLQAIQFIFTIFYRRLFFYTCCTLVSVSLNRWLIVTQWFPSCTKSGPLTESTSGATRQLRNVQGANASFLYNTRTKVPKRFLTYNKLHSCKITMDPPVRLLRQSPLVHKTGR